MYIKQLKEEKSFLEKYKKYHNKFEYSNEKGKIYQEGNVQIRKNREGYEYSEPYFTIYQLSVNLINNTYFYDKNSYESLIDDDFIIKFEIKFKTLDECVRYIKHFLPKNTIENYVFLINKQQHKMFTGVIRQTNLIKNSEFLVSQKKDVNIFEQKEYIPINVEQRVSLYNIGYRTERFVPIISINAYEKLKNAIILSKYGASRLILKVKSFKDNNKSTEHYYNFYFKKNLKFSKTFIMISKELKAFDKIAYVAPKESFDSHEHFVDGLNIELANFSLFINSFFLKYPSKNKFKYLQISAETEQITTDEFQNIFKQYGKKDYSYGARKLWVNDIGFGFYNKNYYYDYTK